MLRYGCSRPLQFNAWATAGVDGGGIGESGDADCDNGLVLQVSQVASVVVTVLLLLLLLLIPYAFRLKMTP
jgi:hypothetical protein